jgi:hypothetical protein
MDTADASSNRDAHPGEIALLWLGLLGPAVIWLTQFEVNYALVPWVCRHGHHELIALVTIVALALTAVLGLLAWGLWRRSAPQFSESADAGIRSRTHFMAAMGLMSSGLFILVIVAQGIAVFFIDPCLQ